LSVVQGINPSMGGTSPPWVPVPRGMGRLSVNSLITLDYISLTANPT